jgi:PPOX class probable F420-dependent enzyme
MLDERARRLLDCPGLLGVVCTCRADGSPQANPVWFRLDDRGDIRIWTDEARHWVANLQRAPHVAFSVHEAGRPWSSVSIRGRAGLDDTLEADETAEEIRRICGRYLAPQEIEAYIDSWPQTRNVVTIHPTAVFAAQAFEDPVAHRRS